YAYHAAADPHPHGVHSFPTRRSSDLPAAGQLVSLFSVFSASGNRVDDQMAQVHSSLPWTRTRCTVRPLDFRASSASRSRCSPRRSEEHTSELQSRRDLVCRLLLEEKT